MKNVVISGYKKSGKTYLARKIVEKTDRNVYGFFTAKFENLAEDGLCPIYIYPAAGDPVIDKDHLVGMCGGKRHYAAPEVFDAIGVKLLETDDDNGLIIIDELGFLESDAHVFQKKVIECLTGDIPAICFIRQSADIPFLEQIKKLSEIDYYVLTEENREELSKRIISSLL